MAVGSETDIEANQFVARISISLSMGYVKDA